jgi:hypothetical protein
VIIIASTDHFSEDIMDNHNIELRLYYDDKSNEYTIVSKILITIIE